MTSLSLLSWIVLGIALQLVIYLGIGFWRHWLNYLSLYKRTAELNLPVTQDVTPPISESSVALWPGFRTFKVERKIFEDAAQSVCSFYLAPEDGKPLPAFLPGQFLTFHLDVPTKDGTEQITRCYSLSDAPHTDCFRISVKRALPPNGSQVSPGRSSNYFHDQIGVGSLLLVRAPAGHFYIDQGQDPVVLIAGGIGITPMLSMLNWCLSEQLEREIWLFYGVRHSHELVMKSHLEELAAAHPNFRLHLCFSDPLPDDLKGGYKHRGRVDVGLLRMLLPLKPYHFYICGPTPMMESLVLGLEDWGVPDARIHFEAFGPASFKCKQAITSKGVSHAEAEETGIVVTFAQSGKQLPWQAASGSLLEFAEKNGIAVNSGCRAGSCGSCQTTIKSGEIVYLQPPEYDPEPGTCLLCVSAPKTSVTLEV